LGVEKIHIKLDFSIKIAVKGYFFYFGTIIKLHFVANITSKKKAGWFGKNSANTHSNAHKLLQNTGKDRAVLLVVHIYRVWMMHMHWLNWTYKW